MLYIKRHKEQPMTRIDQTAAAKTWTEQNNAGNGYSVGNDGADINDLTAELGKRRPRVSLRLSDAEWTEVQAKAGRRPVSVWLRDLALGA